MNQSAHELVIFDCDGVLVESEMISCRVFVDIIRSIGVEMSVEEAYKEFVGGSMSSSMDYVKSKFNGEIPIDITQQYRTKCKEAFEKELLPVDGIVEILENVNVKKCVASNGPPSKISFNLKITGLDKYFDKSAIFSAYDIGIWKPNPDLYLHAATEMGIEPQNCIVIEDSPNGLRAAYKADMLCLGRSHPLKPLPQDIPNTEVYSDMNAIHGRLEELGLLGVNNLNK